MSSNFIDVLSEQLCYVPCSFCNIVLAVGVPCSSLMETVTVRCGHCGNLWAVNMAAAAFSGAATLSSYSQHPPQANLLVQASNYIGRRSASNVARSANHRVVNRAPEKRQRVPSAYNQFIKEEIQRLKANNPDISHREAFSTAAKNWAHFPHIQFGLMLETNNQSKVNEGYDKHLLARTSLLNN